MHFSPQAVNRIAATTMHRRICPQHKKETVKDKTKTETKHRSLTKEDKKALTVAIRQASKDHSESDVLCQQLLGSAVGQEGNAGVKSSTIERYQKVLQGLKEFSWEIGDYNSAILCSHTDCPVNPPPVRVETATMYLNYRIHMKDTPLLHPTTNKPVKFVNGVYANQPVLCQGSWTSKDSVTIYRATINKYHNNNDSTKGPYSDICENCMKSNNNNNGCDYHRGRPQVVLQGNPTNHQTLVNAIKSANAYVESNYEERQSLPFLPSQMRSIRNYLLNSNTKPKFMLWVLFLFCVKQALRIDEALNLRYEDFMVDYFIVKPTHVDSLFFSVQGKRDPTKMFLNVWSDHHAPDLCPVKVLLSWIVVSDIKQGFLFPCQEELMLPQTNNGADNHYPYNHVLKDLKYLGYDIAGIVEAPGRIMGTHFARKSYLKWALMGRADKTNTNSNDIRSQVGLMGVCLTSDMRHKSISTTGIYAADSGSTTILQERHGGDVTNNRVGPYHPIRVVCKHNWLDTMQSCGLPKNKKTLAVLAKWFIFEKVKINRNRFDSHGYTVAALVDLVTSYTVESSLPTQDSATVDDMIRAAKQHFPPAVADQFIPTMRKMTIKNAVDDLNDHLQQVQVQAKSPRPSSALVSPPSTKKQKTKNYYIMEEARTTAFRDAYGSSNGPITVPKLKVLYEALHDLEKNELQTAKMLGKVFVLSQATNSSYRAWVRICKNIRGHVDDCYGGSKEEFVAGNPTRVHSSFRKPGHTCAACAGNNVESE